jgi:hypothetical protein
MRSASPRGLLTLGLAAGLWLTSGGARAASIQPLAQQRYVWARTGNTREAISTPNSRPFDAIVAPTCAGCAHPSASQTSTITANEIHGSGGTSASASREDLGWSQISTSSSAASRISVSFRIEEPIRYDMSGTMEWGDWGGGYGESFDRLAAQWVLLSGGDLVDGCSVGHPDIYRRLCDPSNLEDRPIRVSSSGMLAPGDYTLEIVAEGNARILYGPGDIDYYSNHTSYDLTFRLVPEPAAALLLVQGLLAFALAPRRKRDHLLTLAG